LHVLSADVADGEVTVAEHAVRVRLRSGGRHRLKLKYTAAAGRGIRWFADRAGLATAFTARRGWSVTIRLASAPRYSWRLRSFHAARSRCERISGGGTRRRGKEWRGRDGDHFVFEQSDPVQTYLLSFAVARLAVAVDDRFSIYAQGMDANKAAFARTADAYAFLRAAASVE